MRPANIVQDRELVELLTYGRPTVTIPSPDTVGRDIKAAFEAASKKIAALLRVRSRAQDLSISEL